MPLRVKSGVGVLPAYTADLPPSGAAGQLFPSVPRVSLEQRGIFFRVCADGKMDYRVARHQSEKTLRPLLNISRHISSVCMAKGGFHSSFRPFNICSAAQASCFTISGRD